MTLEDVNNALKATMVAVNNLAKAYMNLDKEYEKLFLNGRGRDTAGLYVLNVVPILRQLGEEKDDLKNRKFHIESRMEERKMEKVENENKNEDKEKGNENGEKEYFVVSNSFAAPIVSDTSTSYIKGVSPEDAMEKYVKAYKHPTGLFAANLYGNADDYHKDNEPLATYRSSAAIKASLR